MTVGQLRMKLEGINPETKVVVKWEIDRELTYFDALDASLRRSTFSRVEGIAVHTLGGDLSLPRRFIDVVEA